MTTRRPGIISVGRVTDTGTTLIVSGWGLTWCAARCDCHVVGGHLALHQGDDGALGLAQMRPCDCCQPWPVDELAAVLRDLQAIGQLETTA